MKSLNLSFRKLKNGLCLLALMLVIQGLLVYTLHSRQKVRLSQGTELQAGYNALLKTQTLFFGRLIQGANKYTNAAADKVSFHQESELKYKEIEKDLDEWSEKGLDNALLSKGIIDEEKRRVDTLAKALSLISEKKPKEARSLVNLEKDLLLAHNLTSAYINESVAGDCKNLDKYLLVSYTGALFLVVPFFVLIVFSLGKMNALMTDDALALIEFTENVNNGGSTVFSGKCRLEEMTQLRTVMEEMILKLKNRHMLNTDEVDRTRESNQQLEKAVEKGRQDVGVADELLSRKNEELEQILYAASHDLRTPLIGIQGFSQELQYLCEMLMDAIKESGVEVENNAKLKEILEKDIPNSVNFIIKGSNKMDSMIQGLLRVSRVGLEELSCEKVDMDELLKHIVDVLSFQAQSASAMILVDPLEVCYGDRQKLEQVFTNLIANAIKYRDSQRNCEIRISCEKTDNKTVYKVKDNGVGISPEALENVFKTFFRADERSGEGQGLGLTIANRIVEKHRGIISVESEEGKGTVFEIIIPNNEEGKSEL